MNRYVFTALDLAAMSWNVFYAMLDSISPNSRTPLLERAFNLIRLLSALMLLYVIFWLAWAVQ